ncbi:eukaryotic translation initiation factor 2D [Lutzomyia longipalpis]|uniref:eukaryotic translation initiation factor 2D n=1 Tax=Lutzomyia longipalpis TaxID=7200 RepID=UPI002483A486|nr:eukaryotic translation initiation factor 2D [Lutzomyia longipalpis]
MFIKQFKVKSKTVLRSSDRNKLYNKIAGKYPNLSDKNFCCIFPSSGCIYHTKIITNSGSTVLVYSEKKQPMFFELASGNIYPTVYTMWLVADLLPKITTHPSVLPIMAKGANLMARGVVKQGKGVQAWGCISRGDVVAVNLTSNTHVCAVGIFSQSSNDLYLNGGNGVCVEILHVFGDKLWAIEPTACSQIPVGKCAVPELTETDFPELGAENAQRRIDTGSLTSKDDHIELDNSVGVIDEVEGTNQKEEQSPDDVLKKAFLTALKFDRQKLTLPLLTSTFYANHVQVVAPENFNIKDTSYKKFTKFMQQMVEEGFLEKKSSNIDSTPADLPIQLLTAMTKLYIVSDATFAFFSIYSHKSGKGLQENEIEKHLMQYVKKRNLIQENGKLIKLDEVLAGICGGQVNSLESYNTVLQDILAKMPANFEMRAKERDKVLNIQISLSTRKGNKKVTLVSNLDSHGIFIPDFANRCKVGVQASTTVIQTATAKGDTLLIQGNQVRFVYNLLTETYRIPKGKVSGLELAGKEPKKNKNK